MARALYCNKCYSEFDSGGEAKGVATGCGHLFCSQCSEATFPNLKGNSSAQCPVCDEDLRRNNLKVVSVLANSSDIKMALFGQAPDTIMHVALQAINFYTVQQQLVSSSREAKLADKAIQMKDQCNKKLQEVHNAYQNAKRKYQTVIQEKTGLEQETKELQDKYRQKSKQNQELQRMFKELQSQNDNIRRNGAPGQMGGHGQCPSPTLSNLTGGGSGHHMVTTVHHRAQAAVFMGGGTPDRIRPNDGGLFHGMGGPQQLQQHNGMVSRSPLSLGGMMLGQQVPRGGSGVNQGHGGMDTSAQVVQQRQQMLQRLPGGGAAGGQPARLLPGGTIGLSHRGF